MKKTKDKIFFKEPSSVRLRNRPSANGARAGVWFAGCAALAGGLAALGVFAWNLLCAPASEASHVYPETRFGNYLAIKHAVWVDDFESVMKFSDALKDSEVLSVKVDSAIGRFLAGEFDDAANVLAGERALTARVAHIAYLLRQDDWKSVYKNMSKEKSVLLSPLRIWSAVAVGRESEALKFIGSLNVSEDWKLFARGMVYAETNRPGKAKAEFDKVPLDFFNLNDYLYLAAFYEKHGFDAAAKDLRADFSSTPGGAFISEPDYGAVSEGGVAGVKGALSFGLIQSVSHNPVMSYSSAALVLLRLAQAADPAESAALDYYLGMFFYNMDSPRYSEYFGRIGAGSPYYPFVMLKNVEKAGNFYEKRSKLRSLLRKNPTFIPALSRLVALDLQKDRGRHAAKAVNKALEQSDVSNKTRAYLLRLRAQIYFQNGDLNRAEDDILKAGDLAPENPDILLFTAKIWAVKKENLDRAYAYAMAVIRESPSDIDGWDALAMVVWAKENASEASEILERVGRIAIGNSALFQHLGDARAALGDEEGAAEAYGRALDFSGDGLSCGEKCLKRKIRRLKY
jgi:tetratricopeptide (TPR) repeat protein